MEGRAQVYVILADGGGQRRMTDDPSDDMTPIWSRDGRSVYFASDRSGRVETWKMPATGGPAAQVTRAGGGTAFESADAKYLYYFKSSAHAGDSGPVFRMPVDGGPEVQILPQVAVWNDFGITAKGIYFTPDERTIQRLDFSSGRTSTLATVDKSIGGLCVSPDEAFVVWGQLEQGEAELMLVEGFR
ncbi:MAG: hypothetical protein WBL61_26060 [Bryobacteraceae bacterium]